MIKVYIKLSQYYNFFDLKEPVMLLVDPMTKDAVEVYLNTKDVIITEHKSYSSIELKTFRKSLKGAWRRLWKKK